MGGLAVAWQVNATLSPSRMERGSMDRVTIGGSRRNTYWMFEWMEIDSARQHDDWFHAQKSHQNYKFHHKYDVLRPHFSTALCAKTELVLHLLLLHFFSPSRKSTSVFLIENSNYSLLVNAHSLFLQGHDWNPFKRKRFLIFFFRCWKKSAYCTALG